MSHGPADDSRPIPLRIRLPFATEAEFIERYGAWLTPGGLFIATRAGHPVGTRLTFEVVLATGGRLLRGEALVQERVEDPAAGQAGMLLRFTRLDSRSRALIELTQEHKAGLERAETPVSHASQPPPRSQPSPVPRLAMPQGPIALADDVVLGIDLGTTTCRAAVVLDGVPRLIPIPSERGVALPSVVAWDVARERMLVGSAARRHRTERPAETIVGFKRLLGRRARSRRVRELEGRLPFPLSADPSGDVGVELGGRTFRLVEFAALLLAELKDAAQEYLGRPLTRAVLSVPAWYTDHQRGALLEAGKLAGLEVLSLCNEPSAVAVAFGYGRGLARKRALVCDLGGGTFDAAVVAITGDDLDVLCTGGDAFLGGMDFDARLAEALVGTLEAGPRERLLGSPVAMDRLRDAAEVAKIALSDRALAPVHLAFATTDDAGAPLDLQVEVERGFLEYATGDLVERATQVTQATLEAARLTAQSIDEVLLVGGQSRAPAVRRRIEAVLGLPARTDVDPAGAVALGAAVLGHGLVLRERGKRGVTLAEVLSCPIGVAVRGGGLRRVLDRNTRLPAEKSLSLPVQGHRPLRLAIFQGSSLRADENEYLGALAVTSERGGDLAVRFVVTADGRLALSATTPDGQHLGAHFSTLEAPDAVQAELLAEAPLPEADGRGAEGLLRGLQRLFGARRPAPK